MNAPPSTQIKSLIAPVYQAMKRQLSVQVQPIISNLDSKLVSRYGDRYTAVKQRLSSAKTWYDNARANAELPISDAFQQKQAILETKAGAAGVALAQREQQMRQRLRGLIQTATKQK